MTDATACLTRNTWTRERVLFALAGGATLLSAALCELPNDQPPLDLWRGAFALTYSAELRAEKKERGQSVVDADPERYRRFTGPALAAARAEKRRRHASWRRRRIEGKALSVLRLAKATATFAGGADYIAWKINRHSGTELVISPWQRRHPLLAAVTLLPRLLKSGAVR